MTGTAEGETVLQLVLGIIVGVLLTCGMCMTLRGEGVLGLLFIATALYGVVAAQDRMTEDRR